MRIESVDVREKAKAHERDNRARGRREEGGRTSASLQVTPSSSRNALTRISLRSLSVRAMPVTSSFHSGYDSSPSFGGVHRMSTPIWPPSDGQSWIDASL